VNIGLAASIFTKPIFTLAKDMAKTVLNPRCAHIKISSTVRTNPAIAFWWASSRAAMVVSAVKPLVVDGEIFQLKCDWITRGSPLMFLHQEL